MPTKINGQADDAQPAAIAVQESADAMPKEEPMTPQGATAVAPPADQPAAQPQADAQPAPVDQAQPATSSSL
jgi:L,D-transpeptidase YbiS